MRGLALALSFMGLATACGGYDDPDGVGTGSSAVSALHYGSLSELTVYNEVGVNGVVREVVDEGGALVITMDVQQTLWAQSGVAPITGTLQFRQESDGAENVAPAVGDDVIVFLGRGTDGAWSAHGGASGRFRVNDGMVTPAMEGGVSLPADTDVASFVAMLTAEPAPSEDTSGYGYGYGGGSY